MEPGAGAGPKFERAAPSAAAPDKKINFELKFTFRLKLEFDFDLKAELKLLKFQLFAFKFKANKGHACRGSHSQEGWSEV